jgi:hypothetical protein
MRLAERFRLGEEYRARIAEGTKLKGDVLAELIADLEVLCGSYRDSTSEPAKRNVAKVAKWYRDVAKAWDRLASLAERRPAEAVVCDLPDARELQIRALRARADSDLHKVKQRPRKALGRRQRSRGADKDRRDWLAGEARRAIERYCGKLKSTHLREVIAAVLEAVDAPFPEPTGHPNQFDAMMPVVAMRPLFPEPGQKQKEQSEAREQRLDRKSI